eukprot:TRINITY_DN1090_c0_g1_i1.p1 TRINITY_DN1090_c0_g1~~TRINITY_DN1090_c0_g1_i1.p1  ORF type:complete len:244 (-),score=68.25 TRINITY_DN1090_c0_g1_i1:451-1161(-)
MAKPLVIITGASSGIGEDCAKYFSAQGHPLLLLARRIERLHALNLPNTMCAKVDVADLESFEKAVKEAEAKYGPPDLLVSNAGCMMLGYVDDQDPATWSAMLNANVLGVINGYRTVVKGMKERHHGTIINISSIAGRKAFDNHGVYCGTKSAVHAISEAFRQECCEANVRVGIVAPGVVETELLNTNSQEVVESYKKALPNKLKAADVTAAIAYIYNAPQNACIREIVLGPTKQLG